MNLLWRVYILALAKVNILSRAMAYPAMLTGGGVQSLVHETMVRGGERSQGMCNCYEFVLVLYFSSKVYIYIYIYIIFIYLFTHERNLESNIKRDDITSVNESDILRAFM